MKYRAPRKKKKQAKRLKAANDAMIIARTSIISVQAAMQLAIISATPCSPYSRFGSVAEKTLRVVEITMDTAKAIKTSMSDIKPWIHFVPNYRMR